MYLSLRLLAPVFSLCTFAFVLFGVDAMALRGTDALRKLSFWIALVGVVISAALLVFPSGPEQGPHLFGHQMLVWDGLSYFLSWIAVLTVFFVILLSERYREFTGLRLSAYFGLLLLAAVGLILLSAANDFLMIFLAIELIGIPSFILTGYLRHKEKSSEAAIKFFLIGAFSSAMLAYGISLLYGLTGTTSLLGLHQALPLLQEKAPIALLAVFFLIVSFGFKIAVVPFHMWVPDAFEGAPIPIAAFLSVAPKIAGAAIAIRVFVLTLEPSTVGISSALAVLAAVTMTIGNVIGLQQTNVIRLLAYSSIAHMGYLLLGLVAATTMGLSSVYIYGWVYLFMNLGTFAIVIALSNAMGSTEISSYAGLARRAPRVSALLVLFVLSLAGIPPTAGFFAKFYVFAAAFDAQWKWLVVIAAVNSLISVGYYFKILHAMYFQAPTETSDVELTSSSLLTLGATSFFTLAIGFAPQFFLGRSQFLAETVIPRSSVSAPGTPAPSVLVPAGVPSVPAPTEAASEPTLPQ